jgi:hypothetical protein
VLLPLQQERMLVMMMVLHHRSGCLRDQADALAVVGC